MKECKKPQPAPNHGEMPVKLAKAKELAPQFDVWGVEDSKDGIIVFDAHNVLGEIYFDRAAQWIGLCSPEFLTWLIQRLEFMETENMAMREDLAHVPQLCDLRGRLRILSLELDRLAQDLESLVNLPPANGQ